jgi:hypothetical protein
MKIGLLGTKLFYTDRRTDMTKLIVAFSNFANAAENQRAEEKLCYQALSLVEFLIVSISNLKFAYLWKLKVYIPLVMTPPPPPPIL